MYDALLFDLDGTLIDTEAVALVSGQQAFAELGSSVSAAFMHSLIGIDQGTARQIIATGYPSLDLVALNTRWQALFVEGTATCLPLKPGVETVLQAFGHLPKALVTSSGRVEAHRKLDVAGLSHYFHAVITVDDVARAKPAPDPYLLAAQMLGTTTGRCLAFEDSEVGAEAAHRAGCVVVQVPDIVPASGRWAHHVADTLVAGARLAGLMT